MVDSVLFSRSNPLLFFRLDPGEPGLLRSARASESTMRVFLQETRNLNRLTARALREGNTVLSSGIQLFQSLEGNTLATRGGRTTVVSRAPRETLLEGLQKARERLLEDAQQEGGNPRNDLANRTEGREGQAEEQNARGPFDIERPGEAQQRELEETRLRAILNRAKNELREAERRVAVEESRAEQAEAERAATRLRLRVARLEQELRDLRRPSFAAEQGLARPSQGSAFGQETLGPNPALSIARVANARRAFGMQPTTGARINLFA